MSTNASVAIEREDGSVYAIYNHSDGYPHYLGKMLVQHYTDPAKVQELIKNGNASFIDENIGEKMQFGDHETRRANKQCVFYARDRGDRGQQASRYKDFEDWRYSTKGQYSYAYVFDIKTGTWAGFDVNFKEIPLPGNPGLTRANDIIDTHNKLG